jgi:hypothetical protein
MGQTVDAVLHDQAHGAGIIIRPYRLGAEFALGLVEPCRHLVERVVPGNSLKLAGALRADPALRIHQPIRVVDPLRVARDLGADHPGRIGLLFGASDPADGRFIDHLDVERAGRRAVVRTGGVPDLDLGKFVHDKIIIIKTRDRQSIYPAMLAQNCVQGMQPPCPASRSIQGTVRLKAIPLPAKDCRRIWLPLKRVMPGCSS